MLHPHPEETVTQMAMIVMHPKQPHPTESSFPSSPQTPFSRKTRCSSIASFHSSFASKLCFVSHPYQPISCPFNVSPSLRVSSMANQSNHLEFLFQSPSEIRKKKPSDLRKREELGREVSTLRKMLNEEEKAHEILEHVDNRQSSSSQICIPNCLPPKMKELLTELAIVEGEIARLEGQISRLRMDLKHEQDVTEEVKSKQWSFGALDGSPKATPKQLSRTLPEKLKFETKSLHFISKVIKGDYPQNDFKLIKKMENFKVVSDKKENQIHEDVKVHDKAPRKSAMFKSSSPLRDPRYPSPKQRDRQPGIALDLPPKSLPLQIQSEENVQNLQPNKLSESIMKCLNFIYVRLLRTSRAVELEKSGPILRSMNSSSLSCRSFRVENGVNTSLALQKESRQQDPYGIFNIEESILRDIGPYKNLVIFTSSSLDLKSIPSSSSIPLLEKLRVLMSYLQNVDLRPLTHQQKLAFWINMYNACIMHGFLQHGVHFSPDKLLALMNKATINIGGNSINAHAIEHYILRKPVSSGRKENYQESAICKLYGFEAADANISFALSSGTRSSPAVRIYTAEAVVAELERSKLEYLQASIAVTSSKTVAFPELLLRNMADFASDVNSLVEWVIHQLPTSGSLRKSMVDCVRGQSKISSSLEKIPYDFEFQFLLAL